MDLLVIEPCPSESLLFLSGSMNFDERVQALRYGYRSAVRFFTERFDALNECFARIGREVSLDGLKTDGKFEPVGSSTERRRFRIPVHEVPKPSRE